VPPSSQIARLQERITLYQHNQIKNKKAINRKGKIHILKTITSLPCTIKLLALPYKTT
jgi:hypothetical protein